MVDKIVPTEAVDSPYYNDYDETKDFYNILFRPGFAVQARELTQLQTIAQKQVQRFGDHIFKNGSLVQGAQISTSTSISLNLASQYNGTDITVSDFNRKYINNSTNTTTTFSTAFVEAVESGSTPVLMVKYVTGDVFANDTIRTTDLANYANISGNQGIGTVASISEGVVFIDGYFARVAAQTIILDKYSTTSSYRVGLELDKSIVLPTSDTSLLDPALEASNFQAPGASRYKITLTLSKRELSSTDDSQFIELMRIENGVIKQVVVYPQYSELEKTLARRTNDESGSYTVRPFNIRLRDHANTTPNADLFTVSLDPGKAYIEGYEFETVSSINLDLKRSRNSSNVNNYALSMNYGNYLLVNNANSVSGASSTGTFKFDGTGIGPQLVDLHCVSKSSINVTNPTSYNTTVIGTARLTNIDYDSASNTLNSSTYNYRLYVSDTKFANIRGTIYSNTSPDRIVLSNVGNTTVSSTANAYLGALIRITSGTLSGITRTIVNYDQANRTAYIDSNVSNVSINANTDTWSILFSAKDIESLANVTSGTPTSINGSYDISPSGKVGGVASGDTILTDTNFTPYLFEFPEDYIKKGSITDQTYDYFKVLGTKTFTSTGGGTSTTGTLSGDTGEEFLSSGTQSSTQALENFIVVIRDNGGNPTQVGANGTILPMTTTGSSIVVNNGVSPATVSFTSSVGNYTFTADILAKVRINSGSRINQKLKTSVVSNSTHILTQGGVANATFANVSVYSAVGQVHLRSPNKTPGQKDVLYVSDVYNIDKVYDIGTAAFTSGTALSSYTDITNRYKIDTGQRDTHYDHGGIEFLPGYTPPSGNVVVCFSYYKHDTGSSDGFGYFSVDSYPGYANIPQYTSISTGRVYDLRDSIDFRPRRADHSNTFPGYTLSQFRIGLPNEEFNADYQYYLARRDKIVLTKDRFFQVIEGAPSLNPQYPREPEGSMVLYNLTVPPYTVHPSNVIVKYIENKRYTMRDIGSLEKRIENLEYYTSLNLLEKDTQLISIQDDLGLERTKNGILVDSFKGHAIGDVKNLDYSCSIDFKEEELRPEAITVVHNMDYDFTNSTGVSQKGGIVTAPYTSSIFISQNVATQTETVQPYLFARFLGSVFLNPESDFYFDKNKLPDVTVNLAGENDAYEALSSAVNENKSVFNTEYGDWMNRSVGTEVITNRINQQRNAGFQVWQDEVQRTTTTTVTTQVQTGIQKQISFDTISAKLGERLVDLSIVPVMRSVDVDFAGLRLKPRKNVYYYFDDIDVTNYVMRANELVFSGNHLFDLNNSERITSGTGNSANVILSRTIGTSNIAYITDISGNVLVGQTWTGSRSSNSATVIAYRHYSGTARSGTANSVNLSFDASSTDDYYNGNTIYFVDGLGIGGSYRIDDYVGSTRRAINTSISLNVTTGSNTRYSIGTSKTNEYGQVSGTFVIPSTSSVNFKVGERTFRILDSQSGSLGASTTSADAKFAAQGIIASAQDVVVTTRVPVLQRSSVTSERIVRDVVTSDQVLNTTLVADFTPPPADNGQGDPLSQTFFIDKKLYPEGVFLDSVDLFFAAKDSSGSIPVEIQIRPTVNGYPHSSLILPNGRVVVDVNDVKTSDLPDTSNTSTATTFTFTAPLYVPPGEFAIVVYSDSPEYEVYLAKLGETVLGTDRKVSKQPYVGSLFKSQNSTTWTPYQDQDLMFVMKKCNFTTNSIGSALFNVRVPSSNTNVDEVYVKSDQLKFASSAVQYSFKSKPKSTGTLDTAFTSIVENDNYEFNNDGKGRRIINSAGDFIVKAELSTSSEHVTPVIDVQRVGLFTNENYVNNANLSNSTVVVTDSGAGHTSPTVTISGGNGSGATAVANVVGGIVDRVYITSFGSGYTETPTITISEGGATRNATAIILGETRNSGGNYLARYISRRVELEDGFDSSDLRVFLTAYKPSVTDIQVYYKIKSADDPEDFDSKNYVRMQQYTRSSLTSTNNNDYIEYEYRPSLNTNSITYTSGGTTYTSFKYFAIKIVMSTSNSTIVPKIRDLRAIALPAG